MAKQNCWEFKKCGREPGGNKIYELGICPAPTETRLNGINHGKNGGRACWALSGTFCRGEVQGTFAMKLKTCFGCDFYKKTWTEEGGTFQQTQYILEKLS